MAVDAFHLQMGQGGGLFVQGQGVLDGNTELGGLQARGDVGVGLGVHVRVDPQADGCLLAQAAGHQIEALQFGGRFHVEAEDAGVQGLLHLGFSLADPGEHHLAGIGAGG